MLKKNLALLIFLLSVTLVKRPLLCMEGFWGFNEESNYLPEWINEETPLLDCHQINDSSNNIFPFDDLQHMEDSNVQNNQPSHQLQKQNPLLLTIPCPIENCTTIIRCKQNHSRIISYLINHVENEHANSPSYSDKCTLCNKSINTFCCKWILYAKLKNHYQLEHNTSLPESFNELTLNPDVVCPECYKIFGKNTEETKTLLTAHLEKEHQKSQNNTIYYVNCFHCGTLFYNSSYEAFINNFRIHIKNHTFTDDALKTIIYQAQIPIEQSEENIKNYLSQEQVNSSTIKLPFYLLSCPKCNEISTSHTIREAYQILTKHFKTTCPIISSEKKDTYSAMCSICNETFISHFDESLVKIRLKIHILDRHPAQLQLNPLDGAITASNEQEEILNEIRSTTRPREIEEIDQNDSVKKMKISYLLN